MSVVGNHFDNGMEYNSSALKHFCYENGISHQLTTPYAPEHNRVAERRNLTIIEMVRCMLFDMKLLNKFWAKTALTAVYIQNRCYTSSVKSFVAIES